MVSRLRGGLMALLACFVAAPLSLAHPDEGFSFRDEEGRHLDILHGGKVVGRYMYAHDRSTKESLHATYKPYLHVFDREGKAPITKGPGGQYTHHRGIFVGWSRLGVAGKRYDRWHMKGGEQIHRSFTAKEAGAGEARFVSLVHWTGDDGKTILEEERTMVFRTPPAGAYVLVDLMTKLTASAGEVELSGDPEHAGIQYRPANEVDRKATVYVFPRAEADPKKDVDYAWVGETYALGGKQYSVVIMNHPENPKGTRFSAYRNYGRFGAYPTARIAEGDSRTLRYRFLVAEGSMLPAGRIQETCNAFTGSSDPAPKTRVIPTGK